MKDTYALLVLAEPPQSTAWDDLHLALWPTLEAVVDRLHQAADSVDIIISLDIALPVTRIWKEASSFAELRTTIIQILSSIYQLINVECQRRYLPSARKNSRHLEATIVLVHERPEHEDDYDTISTAHASVWPLAFQDLKTFARGSRPWSRIFQVDSTQGDRVYRKLRKVAANSIARTLHEKVERLPAGIQMYIPRPMKSSFASTMTPDSEFDKVLYRQIVANVENGAVTLAGKVSLTAALIMPVTEDEKEKVRTKSEKGTLIVIAEGETLATDVVVKFLEVLLGSRLSIEAEQFRLGTRRWEAVLDNGPVIVVDSRETVDIVAIPIRQEDCISLMPGRVQGWDQRQGVQQSFERNHLASTKIGDVGKDEWITR